jgi:hypothetical protein
VLALLVTVTERIDGKRVPRVEGNIPRKEGPARQLLIASGFFDHVKPSFFIKQDKSFSGSIAHEKGFIVDAELAERLTAEAVETVFGEPTNRKGVYVTLLELMANTRQHAIPEKPQAKRWWTLLFRDNRRKRAQFVFLDTGVGILDSVRTKFEKFIAKLPFIDNQPRILEEIMNGSFRTRTGLSYRGKGLPVIRQYLAERKHFDNLKIITNNVMADVSADSYVGLSSRFSGTLFFWELQ